MKANSVAPILAGLVLMIHLGWLLWIILGACWTQGRPRLAGLHIASLLWGIVVEVGPWPCPLTLVEQFLEAKAGLAPIRAGFLIHYLDRIVYPNLPAGLLAAFGVGVCAVNLGIYGWRYQTWRIAQLH